MSGYLPVELEDFLYSHLRTIFGAKPGDRSDPARSLVEAIASDLTKACGPDPDKAFGPYHPRLDAIAGPFFDALADVYLRRVSAMRLIAVPNGAPPEHERFLASHQGFAPEAFYAITEAMDAVCAHRAALLEDAYVEADLPPVESALSKCYADLGLRLRESADAHKRLGR